jgi:hypothetical protein
LFFNVSDIFKKADGIKKVILALATKETVVTRSRSSIIELLNQLSTTCDPENFATTMFSQLQERILKFKNVFADVMDSASIYVELGSAEALLEFVKEIKHEENLNMIDSVEENVDSFIKAEVVSDFDLVRKLLKAPLQRDMNPLELLQHIRNLALNENKSYFGLNNNESKKAIKKVVNPQDWLLVVANRIRQCSENTYSLKDLYKRLSQKQELTKAIIARILKNGTYHFYKNEITDLYTVEVECYQEANTEKKKKYSEERLQDFKSSALLQVNSKNNQKNFSANYFEEANVAEDPLQLFLKLMALAGDIVNDLNSLKKLGHFNFRNWRCGGRSKHRSIGNTE